MHDPWKIIYTEYDPSQERLRESLCALGNGYFVTRGAAEECKAGAYHYPGTYLAGGYNRLETEIAGRIIHNEDLVNWPNWLVLKFKKHGGDWVTTDSVTLNDYKHELNVKQGILTRTMLFTDEAQHETELVARRIVSMRNQHLACIQWTITPKNWSGKITVHAALDGSVTNSGVERYRALNSKHLHTLEAGVVEEDIVYLKVTTTQSEVVMAQASRFQVYFDSPDYAVQRKSLQDKEYIAQEVQLDVEENKPVILEKIVSVYTSRDRAITDPLTEAKVAVKQAPRFDVVKEDHAHAWEAIWDRCDIQLEDGNDLDQVLLRLHIFHLFQTCSLNIIDLDVGVPARGWHGEAYRGHILWDELFIFPFINFSLPEITRALLIYRYRRLPEARKAAREAGYEGAMFPWQSGSNGREESQVIHLNPQSGRWIADHTYLQRHVNGAIAYNVWQYFQVTGDIEFLSFYGAEMLLEIARFWASKAEYNREKQRYEILCVVGPDEYHTQYPGATEPGLNNNAYTNIMAVWSLMHALRAIKKLDHRRVKHLMQQLSLTQKDLDRWEAISCKMFIPFLNDGVIEQFEGFDKLKDLDWKKYHDQYGEILRLDRILEKEGDSVDNYKAVKQADVLMLFYLFSTEELDDIVHRLGYAFNAGEQVHANIAYYQKITSHGSTLSKLVYSWVLARSMGEKSWRSFSKAIVSDFQDIQGGTTAEGIHLGAMAGTVDLIQRCYGGIECRAEAIWFKPQLPEKVQRIKFRLRYRAHWLEVDITKSKLHLKSHGGWNATTTVVVHGRRYTLKEGQEKTFTFGRRKPRPRSDSEIRMETRK